MANKYLYLWILQGWYGVGTGWEDLCASESHREIIQNHREYRENERGMYRIINRREVTHA
jgi:hypothetical protein